MKEQNLIRVYLFRIRNIVLHLVRYHLFRMLSKMLEPSKSERYCQEKDLKLRLVYLRKG